MNAHLKWMGVERRMAANTVNLDALIPRADFEAGEIHSGGNPRQNISLSDLASNGFFQNNLRKPDFQRETTHWSPDKAHSSPHFGLREQSAEGSCL